MTTIEELDRQRLIASLERTASNEVRDATWAVCVPLHGGATPHTIVRDLAYGPHERHRIDLHLPVGGAADRPVLLYVHGGGFVGGDKSVPGMPFYDNVGRFAVEAGFVGATITYRLAPEAHHPDGAEDVAEAVRFLVDTVGEHGGRADAIVVMGHSAGAALVAGFAADPALLGRTGDSVRGLVLSSGIYTPALLGAAPPNPYYGEDAAGADAAAGVASTDLPILLLVAEYDPPNLQRQALALAQSVLAARATLPELLVLAGHNHFSSTTELGGRQTWFGERIVEFVDRVTRRGE